MKIFRVEPKYSHWKGKPARHYTGFIVVAGDPISAKRMHPDGKHVWQRGQRDRPSGWFELGTDFRMADSDQMMWPSPDFLSANVIGEADKRFKRGNVIFAGVSG